MKQSNSGCQICDYRFHLQRAAAAAAEVKSSERLQLHIKAAGFCVSAPRLSISSRKPDKRTNPNRPTEGRFQETTLEMTEWSLFIYHITSSSRATPVFLFLSFFLKSISGKINLTDDEDDDGATRTDFNTLVRRRENVSDKTSLFLYEVWFTVLDPLTSTL